MTTPASRKVVYTVGFAALAVVQTAHAQQVSVLYSPLAAAVPAPVPGLGGMLIAVLAGVLMAAAAWRLRRAGKTSQTLFTIAFAAGLAVALAGASQIARAVAPSVIISGTGCAGGQSQYDATLSGQLLTNSCQNTMRVDNYVGQCPAQTFLDSSECPAGTVLNAGGSCKLPFCSQN